jgi:hypothetical protein
MFFYLRHQTVYENNTFLQDNNNDEMAKKIYSNKQQKNVLAQTKKALSLIQINAIITQNFKNKSLILKFALLKIKNPLC